MNKTARIFFTLLLAVFLLPACTRKQAPTQLGNATGSDSGNNSSLSNTGDFDANFIPEGPDDWGLGGEGELTARGDGIGNGMYGDFTMVEGVLPSVYFGFDSSSVAASGLGSILLVAARNGPVFACQPGILALSWRKERS
jgi:hypothetical protein